MRSLIDASQVLPSMIVSSIHQAHRNLEFIRSQCMSFKSRRSLSAFMNLVPMFKFVGDCVIVVVYGSEICFHEIALWPIEGGWSTSFMSCSVVCVVLEPMKRKELFALLGYRLLVCLCVCGES